MCGAAASCLSCFLVVGGAACHITSSTQMAWGQKILQKKIGDRNITFRAGFYFTPGNQRASNQVVIFAYHKDILCLAAASYRGRFTHYTARLP
jgi:hypothetical protein